MVAKRLDKSPKKPRRPRAATPALAEDALRLLSAFELIESDVNRYRLIELAEQFAGIKRLKGERKH